MQTYIYSMSAITRITTHTRGRVHQVSQLKLKKKPTRARKRGDMIISLLGHTGFFLLFKTAMKFKGRFTRINCKFRNKGHGKIPGC